MARRNLRRSRAIDSDEDEIRENTPVSTAVNDGKRARRSLQHDDDEASRESDNPSNSQDSDQNQGSPDHALSYELSSSKPLHQPGAIVRVKLTNFVTYTSAEFFPGPNLNMVIGPNGTGKSTLVCAICLGLGWGTQYLGRAKDAAEFVKHGCKEATIEIELQRATKGKHASRRNPVITRTIKREGNKSTYTLNRAATSGKAIMDLARSFDIQIDNLCQFLPQDKVVEFAQMTPIQILESTQRAAAPPKMLDIHQNLKVLRTEQREFTNNNKGDREQLANLENRQEMQRTEVERLRERAIVQKKLEWLNRCRPIPQYAEAVQKTTNAKLLRKALKDELKKLERETQPALQKLKMKTVYEKQVLALKQQRAKDLRRAEQECDRLKREVSNCDTAIKELEDMRSAEKGSSKKDRGTIAREKERVKNLKIQQSTPPEPFDSRAMNQKVQDLTTRRRELEEEIEHLRNQAGPLGEQAQARQQRYKELKQEQENLSTETGQMEAKLQDISRDTSQAWTWIKQNRDMFVKHVYGPPLVECSMKDPSRASQIESLLQVNDFKVITTQCQEDFKLLQRELIDKKRLHDISLRQCELESLDGFRRPLTDEQLQDCGLDGWVIDLLDGPATVLAMMCQEKYLHQTATAVNDISDEQYRKVENSAVKGFVAKQVGYQFSRRKEYGAAGNSAKTLQFRPARFWNNQSNESGRKAEVAAKMRELAGEMAEIKSELAPLRARRHETSVETEAIEKEIAEIKADKEAKQKALADYKGLETRIKQSEDRIADAQRNQEQQKVRLDENMKRQDEVMFEKAEIVLKYVDAVHLLQGRHKESLETEVLLIEAQNDVAVLSIRNQNIIDLIDRKTKEEKEATDIAEKEKAKALKLRDEVMTVRDDADKLEQEGGESGFRELLDSLVDKTGLKEKDLDDMMEIENAKLQLTEGGDANALREFEERAKKIDKLRTRMADFVAKQADFLHAIKELREAWEPELDKLVSKISDAFGDSFARIGCAGQVAVYKASSEDAVDCTEEMGGTENGLDFANWAIHISVKFREEAPLTLLDSHRQSGGERAVSTIFYLMALQSLSRAPFRVVDEINQGMDPRNERMVHGRMVDIAAADENGNGQGSQYFLITPKLLSGLKYRPGMTVLCIVSGENMPNAADTRKKDQAGKAYVEPGRKIDFAAFARKARELGLSRGAGKRIDPNSYAGVRSSFGSFGGSQAAEVGA